MKIELIDMNKIITSHRFFGVKVYDKFELLDVMPDYSGQWVDECGDRVDERKSKKLDVLMRPYLRGDMMSMFKSFSPIGG